MIATDAHIIYINRVARHFQIERNFFYSLTPYCSRESAFSISSCDYSSTIANFADIQLTHRHEAELVLSSTIFEKLSPEVENSWSQKGFRAQVTMGAEFLRHENTVMRLIKMGCGLDILIDRPLLLHNQIKFSELAQTYDIRFCILLNKYFPITEVLRSLPDSILSKSHLLVVPPTHPQSVYYPAAWASRIVQSLETPLPLLIFPNLAAGLKDSSEREFFSEFNLNSVPMLAAPSRLRNIQSVFTWLLQRKWILLLDILHSILLFIRHPSLEKVRHLVHLLMQNMRNTIESTKRALIFAYNLFRYRFWHFIRYRAWNFFRYDVWHFLRFKVLYFLFFPALKIYWFMEYQIQTRVLPRIREKADKE